jgi:hypothetical protein
VGELNKSEEVSKTNKIILLKSYWDKVNEGDTLALVLSSQEDNPIDSFYIIWPWVNIKSLKELINSDLKSLLYQVGDQIISKNALRLEWLYHSLLGYIKNHSEWIVELNITLDLNKPNDAVGWFWDDWIWFYDQIQEMLWDLYGLTKKTGDLITLTEFTKFIYSLIFYSANRNDYPLIWISSRFIVELFDSELIYSDKDLQHRVKVNNDNLFDLVLFQRIKRATDTKEKDMLGKFVLLLIRDLLSKSVRKPMEGKFFENLDRISEREISDLGDNFWKERRDMLFGLVTWIFKWLPQSTNPEIRRNMITSVLNSIECSFVDWIKLFSDSLSRESEWDTSSWDMPSDWRVHMVDSRTWPEKTFILWLYRFYLNENTAIWNFDVPRDFRYLDVSKWLDDLTWLEGFHWFNITAENTQKIKNILASLKELEDSQSRSQRLAGALVSEKVDGFINDLQNSYLKSSKFLKNLFAPSSNVDLWENEAMFWHNQFLEKVWFVDSSYSIIWMGESYGRSFWEWQTRLVLDGVKKKMMSVTLKNIEDIKDKIIAHKNSLVRPVIMVYWSRNYEVLNKMFWNNINWDRENNFRWEIDGVKVYEYFNPDNEKSEILLFDLDKISEIAIQASNPPWQKPWGSIDTIPGFYFELENISENHQLLEEILNNPPEWLDEEYLKEQKYSSIEEYLRDRVQFKMFFSYKISVEENAGWIFRLTNKAVQSLED